MIFREDPANQVLIERLKDRGVIIDMLGGNCPVQGEGQISHESGKRVAFYFRARGSRWSVTIGRKGRETADDAWEYGEPWPGGNFDAGYIEDSEALLLIDRAITFWKKEGAPLNPGHNLEHLLAHLGRGYAGIKSLGFTRWLRETGSNTADMFQAIHLFGTEREDEIAGRIYNEIERRKSHSLKQRKLVVVGEDDEFSQWLCDGSKLTIDNILEMQR